MTDNTKYLSANILKYIAIFAMTIDHIAWNFVDKMTPLGQCMHIIGRLTLPIMSFFIAEGYYKTSNIKKYITRLSIFAVISAFAYSFCSNGFDISKYNNFGVIYTLLLGLIAIIVWNSNFESVFKYAIVIALCIISLFGDWPIFGILYCLTFAIYHNNFSSQCKAFTIISIFMVAGATFANIVNGLSPLRELYQFGVFLAIPLLYLYNGKRGKGGKFNKWIFYIFYPLHLLVIGIIKYYII